MAPGLHKIYSFVQDTEDGERKRRTCPCRLLPLRAGDLTGPHHLGPGRRRPGRGRPPQGHGTAPAPGNGTTQPPLPGGCFPAGGRSLYLIIGHYSVRERRVWDASVH